MPRSDSGRVVIDLDPEFKKELYGALTEDDSNLKAWFLERAMAYLEDKRQPPLFPTQSDVLGHGEAEHFRGRTIKKAPDDLSR